MSRRFNARLEQVGRSVPCIIVTSQSTFDSVRPWQSIGTFNYAETKALADALGAVLKQFDAKFPKNEAGERVFTFRDDS